MFQPSSPSRRAVRRPLATPFVLLCFLSLCFPLLLAPTTVDAVRIACVRTVDCERAYMVGSICQAGSCSNPLTHGGCLAHMGNGNKGVVGSDDMAQQQQQQQQRIRVCHSEDAANAVARGHCRAPDQGLDYLEIRIATQNWEGVWLQAWILQILLSEGLGVPVTIESGSPDVNLDFYDVDAGVGYGTANDWEALRRGQQVGDCRNLVKTADGSDYQACAHVLPEVWVNHLKTVNELVIEGVVEPSTGLGIVGQQAWFIPRFTGVRDPTLISYLGLQGQANRHKLARTFKRPTTWGDYCAEESDNNCQPGDDVASRPPATPAEADRLFVEGLYTGYFRYTAENDCVTFPDTCTGHIADFPCGWLSFLEQQAHHLDIALRSSGPEPGSRGWSYSQLLELWAAANATKSDIMMQWWSPEPILYQTFLGTDAEFQVVQLPPPTQQCITSAIGIDERCSADPAVRVGDPIGACSEPPYPLQKVIGTSLYDLTLDVDIPLAKRSPAYETIKAFTLSSLQLGELFDKWLARDATPAFDLRAATCEWIVEHWDHLEQFIPRTYPRVSQEDDKHYTEPFFYATLGVGGLAVCAVLVTAALTWRQRGRAIIRHAQVEFLWILLAGLLLVTVGSIVSLLPPTQESCILTTWLINVGYTLELVPLIVKVAAIQKLMTAARQMKRMVLGRQQLFGVVFGLSFLVVIFLGLWTLLDAPERRTIYSLSEDTTDQDETIVHLNYFCQSDTDMWRYLAALWHSLLLLTASVLAFQTRKLRSDFSETQTLGLMIYSQFVFVCLRILSFSLESGENQVDMVRFRSLIFSCDALSAIAVYFVTKFVAKDDSSLETIDVSQSLRTHTLNHGGSWRLPDSYPKTKSVNESGMIHSIMEGSDESGSEPSEAFAARPVGVEQYKETSFEEVVADRLTNYLSKNTTGALKCNHCGNAYTGVSKLEEKDADDCSDADEEA